MSALDPCTACGHAHYAHKPLSYSGATHTCLACVSGGAGTVRGGSVCGCRECRCVPCMELNPNERLVEA